MASLVQSLHDFLAANPHAALVDVIAAKGSTPREKGAWMLVSADRIFGTIGGGQLEYMAIDKARGMLAAPSSRKLGAVVLNVGLGPEIGQCCGGRVDVSVRLVDTALAADLVRTMQNEDARYPHVYVFGGGHVGHALANALGLLPLRTVVVETRAAELQGLPETVETQLTAVPEELVRMAPPNSAFLILTHDHALDFLIVAEALKRNDAGYVGMIGSRTKKATFKSWFLKNAGGSETAFARLVSPIGGDAVKDKRPAVIAALAAAEVMTTLTLNPVQRQTVSTSR